MDAIAGYLRDRGWETVITRARDDAGASLFVAASTENLAELEGKWRFKLFFGAAAVPIDSMSPAEVVIDVQRTVARLLAGMFGMLILLLAFGSTLPDLMQKGSLDLLLARPIGRTRLLLFTYAGAVLTVLLVTAAIYGVCAVTLGLRSGHFSWAFVACALPTTAVFAAVFPVAMLVGLVTRNGNFAALAALVCYGAADVAARRTQFVEVGFVNDSWKPVLEVLWWITPKTGEIETLGALSLGRSELSAAGFERFRQQLPAAADMATAYGTTALFAAFFLGATILLFRRRDL
jgi:ABC-type transport system involved in multi-copper enzyme maturation permease subunit